MRTTVPNVEKALEFAVSWGNTSEGDWSFEYFTVLALRAKFILGVISKLNKGNDLTRKKQCF